MDGNLIPFRTNISQRKLSLADIFVPDIVDLNRILYSIIM